MASGIRDDLPGRPYIDTLRLADGSTIMGQTEFTAVVIDPQDFDRLMDELLTHPPGNVTPEGWEESVAKLRYLRSIPGVGRGSKTAWLFERYDVKTNVMGVMVRGEGMNVAQKMGLITKEQHG